LLLGGCGTHIEVIVESPMFQGTSKLNQHKMVHQLIKRMFQAAKTFDQTLTTDFFA